MTKIFLATHGHMASGMKSSIELLMGKNDNLTVFDAYVNENDNLEETIEKFFCESKEDETNILLSDIYGGSVNQLLMQYIDRKNTFLITGVNLPMLLEIITQSDENLDREKLNQIIENAKEFTKLVQVEEQRNEEDFFE